jgi:hypothetical protein
MAMHWGFFILLSYVISTVLGNSVTYIPGVSPSAWDVGEEVLLVANKISSTDSPVVYDYYDLPFCKRVAKAKTSSDNLGESLSGDMTTLSPYEVRV